MGSGSSYSSVGTDVTQLIYPERGGISGRLNRLNAGWHDAVASAFDIDQSEERERFQLIQGTAGLSGRSSVDLYSVADSCPHRGRVGGYLVRDLGRWSLRYFRFLLALAPLQETGLRGFLGEKYDNWIAYRNAGLPDAQLSRLFGDWAQRSLPESQLTEAQRRFNDALSDVQYEAINRFLEQRNWAVKRSPFDRKSLAPYTTANTLRAEYAMAHKPKCEIAFDSDRIEHLETAGPIGPYRSILSCSGEDRADALELKILDCRIQLTGEVRAYGFIKSDPGPWCDLSIVDAAAEAEHDERTWDAASNAGRWDSFFGPNGTLSMRYSELFVVRDFDLTLMLHGQFDDDEVAQIVQRSKTGIWPFFSATGPLTYPPQAKRQPDGTLSLRFSHPNLGAQVWGGRIQTFPG